MKKLTVCLLIAAGLFAQSDKKKLAFEVVSIKPGAGNGFTSIPNGVQGGRYSASNASLRLLIGAAYADSSNAVTPVEITGLPKWAETDKFDVQAQTEAGASPTKQQTMEMLQVMLEDRFRLKIRKESKEGSIYALVVDKDGVKMRASETPTDPPSGCGSRGRICLMSKPVTSLIPFLTIAVQRKIVDRAGLTGLYDIDLQAALSPLPPGAETDPNVPTLFAALREQLGLRLTSETGPVDAFVVESVERPSEN